MKTDTQTPGVYIQEVNAFPNQVVGIPTAVPGFIGYTAQANLQGKSVVNQPVKIQSLNEFEAIFGKGPTPQYYLQLVPQQPTDAAFLTIANQYYTLLPDPNSCYYLYNSIRLFYLNGGNEAYIVSVGAYGPASGKPIDSGAPLINPNVRLSDLLTGLAALQLELALTLYLCPDACLLSENDNGALMQAMLTQCSNLQTAMSLLDVQDGRNPDQVNFMSGINTFRDQVGSNRLEYGAAYYPFVNTSVCSVDEINYTNLFGGDIQPLIPILSPKSSPDPATEKILDDVKAGAKNTVEQMNQALLTSSAGYRLIMQSVLSKVNLLPPASAIAGIITMMDNTRGIWTAPANVSVNGAISLPINLSDVQQQNLNIDPVSGKSINAIRNFAGKGIVVWGARTLDGNSPEWRYISVRRTVTWIEQSCKLALQPFALESNNQNTWQTVIHLLSSFLFNIWQSGGLLGSTANDAFSVQCGLGVNMGDQDILDGVLRVTILVAVIRPAEFVVITLQIQTGS